jgi:hypothetical protein
MGETGTVPGDGLFADGPPRRLEAWVGLHPYRPASAFRAAAIAWLPLALLSVGQAAFAGWSLLQSFAWDIAAHARYLIALPILVFAEGFVAPRLGAIAHHFLEAGLVAESDRPAFDRAVASTRRLEDHAMVELLVVIVAWGLFPVLLGALPAWVFPGWVQSAGSERLFLTLAGWWHVLVSVPLLIAVLLGWIWRLLLWARFLARMSRLDLRLVPAHPDRAAGLMFVSYSLRACSMLAMGVACIVAGGVTKSVVLDHVSPREYRYLIAGVVVLTAVALTAPLLVFGDRLLQAWRRGVSQYGALALALGQRFERRWFAHDGKVGDEALEAPDFSAGTDLYQIVANVYQMRLLPVDLSSLLTLVWSTLLPFVPVLLMAVPVDTILQKVVELVLL